MVFEYSFWWIFPAIFISFTVAYLKFRKLSRLPDIAKEIVLLISSLRFFVILALLILLLNPALSILHRIKEKPLLVVAQDNSISLLKNKDSLYYSNEYKESLDRIVNRLADKFEVVRLTFGTTVKREGVIDFSENRTDMAAVVEYVNHNFIAHQPEGMILLTDGIYNSGVNPRYKNTAFPIYTVALGDTTSYPDVYIRSIMADKFNFLNTIFPLKTEIAALKQKGKNMKCILRENGNPIEERSIKIDHDNFLEEITFEIEAKRKGVIRYSVTLETEFAERTRENNKAETWVHIIDNSGDIAIFANAPHPDVSAIVNAVNVSGIYQCREHYFNENFDTLRANLIVLHNPEAGNTGYRRLIQEAEKRKIAIWYILTDKKSISDFARFDKRYTVNFTSDLNEYVTVGTNPDFPFFEFTDEERSGYAAYPPLVLPFGNIQVGAGRTLFFQKIKNTPTANGIITFYEQGGKRVCYFWGEGLWRWRLYSYRENGNHELFNTLINKMVGYLAAQKSNERFIHDIKPVYGETEETLINVELYNDSYELVNTPDVKLNLKYGDKTFDYSLNRNGNKYRINFGNLQAGEYAYELSVNLKGEAFRKDGIFYVRSNNPELNDIVANRNLLKEIAETTNARTFDVKETDQLVNLLMENDKLKPVYKSETEFIELSRMGILGLILLLLLCTEWFLLKFFAG